MRYMAQGYIMGDYLDRTAWAVTEGEAEVIGGGRQGWLVGSRADRDGVGVHLEENNGRRLVIVLEAACGGGIGAGWRP